MFSETVGSFLKSYAAPAEELPDIRPGCVYRHLGPGDITETAKVIDVGPDSMGIPHVRYEVLVERSRVRHTHFAAVRTLNLETFSHHFVEAMEA